MRHAPPKQCAHKALRFRREVLTRTKKHQDISSTWDSGAELDSSHSVICSLPSTLLGMYLASFYEAVPSIQDLQGRPSLCITVKKRRPDACQLVVHALKESSPAVGVE